MEINEMSSIPDLKKYAAENGIELPSNIRTKGAILKYIAESSGGLVDGNGVEATSDSDVEETTTENGSSSTVEEHTDKLPGEKPDDHSTDTEQVANDRLIVRSDSQGIHTYNRDTGVSTLTRYDEVL